MSEIFTVDDFLSIDFINKAKKELLNIPEDWWYISLKPTDERYVKENFRNFEGILNNPDFLEKNLFNLNQKIYKKYFCFLSIFLLYFN